MQTHIIDFKEILSGVSLASRAPTTGISPDSLGINLDFDKGVLHFQKAPSDRGTVITNEICARTTDYGIFTNALYLVDASKKFYKMDNAGTITNPFTGTKTYQTQTTDLIQFKSSYYCTSLTDVAKINGSFSAFTAEDWWTTTMGKPALDSSAGFPHILEVVEDKLYISDRSSIHTYDGTTAVVASLIVPSTEIITFMIKHPNGRDLVVFTTERMNASDTLQSVCKAYTFDLFKQSFIEVHEIDAQVDSGIVIGGTLYVVYGGNVLGYYNGQAINFLRDLKIPLSFTYTVTKAKLANMKGALLIAENDQILALRNLGLGAVYYYPIQNDTGYPIGSISHLGSLQLFTTGREINGGSYVTLLYDLTQRGYAGRVVTDWIKLPANAWVRKVQVEHNSYSSGSYDIRLATFNRELGGQIYPADGTSTSYWMYNVKTSELQLRIKPMYGTPMGIRRIIVYYELEDVI
jgi:hypothetical protein